MSWTPTEEQKAQAAAVGLQVRPIYGHAMMAGLPEQNGSQTWIGVYSWEDVQSVALTHLGKTL